MKTTIVWMVAFAAVAVWSEGAFAQCCDATDGSVAPPYQNKKCDEFFSFDQFQPKLPAGCGDSGDYFGPSGNCFGGALHSAKGCICVGGTCFSDGGLGEGMVPVDDRTCTRDAVAACCDAGHCQPVVPGAPVGFPCASAKGGLQPNGTCASGCCLTVLPVPNSTGMGSGVCVAADNCSGTIGSLKACSVASNPLTFADDSNDCGAGGCCLSLLPGMGGVCVDAANCS